MYKATAVAIAAAEFFALLKVKLEVVFLYPAYFSKDKAENPWEDSRNDETDEDKTYPVKGGEDRKSVV